MALGICYFNQGFRVFNLLATKNFYKEQMGLQPDYAQFLASIISFPWSLKFFYGLIADNFPIFGSRRKAYVVFSSLL